MRFLKGFAISVAVFATVGVGGYVVISLALWGASFIRTAPGDCVFGTVSNAKYRALLRKAQSQDWTVWPGLSRGLFWPSDHVFNPPATKHNSNVEKSLLEHVRTLAPEGSSFDEQLASAHALMRSIEAEYTRATKISGLSRNGHPSRRNIYLGYSIPQRRFAPLCVFCFAEPGTDITFKFIETSTGYTLRRVVVRHSGLKYHPPKSDKSATACPDVAELQ